MSLHLIGIGVSSGLAMGPAHILRRGELRIPEYPLAEDEIPEEIERYQRALHDARAQLEDTRARIPKNTLLEISTFIDTHLLMLNDSSLTLAPVQLIRERRCNAEWALKLQRDAVVDVFEAMDDPYLSARRDDIDHVVDLIQRILLRHPAEDHELGDGRLRGAIVIADQLTPGDTVLLHEQQVGGFVTEYGAPMSHTAIMARSLGLPAVVGVRNASRWIQTGEAVILDGQAGVVIADPDAQALRQYEGRQREQRSHRARLLALRDKPAVTSDGRQVALLANIEAPEDAGEARKAGAQGVGLYRTEFLYMNRASAPDEDEHYAAYAAAIHELRGLPLTIRTLDLGADKPFEGMPQGRASSNPALGLRAVRLCLRERDLFMPQLRAALRASARGPVRLMIPMVATLGEITQVRALLDEARRDLVRGGQTCAAQVPLGIMVEVPAAAVAAPLFVRAVDFLSIGTNDLIQYTLAIDRIDDEVNYLYDPLHPAVLRLLHSAIQAGRRAGKPVTLCGEMAGDPRYTRLLLGLGLTEFSMSPSQFLEIKRIVRDSSITDLTRRVRRILRTTRPERIAGYVDELNREDAAPAP